MFKKLAYLSAGVAFASAVQLNFAEAAIFRCPAPDKFTHSVQDNNWTAPAEEGRIVTLDEQPGSLQRYTVDNKYSILLCAYTLKAKPSKPIIGLFDPEIELKDFKSCSGVGAKTHHGTVGTTYTCTNYPVIPCYVECK